MPTDGWPDDLWVDPAMGLAHFVVLRTLTLWDTVSPAGACSLLRLPTSLTSLMLTNWWGSGSIDRCPATQDRIPTLSRAIVQ